MSLKPPKKSDLDKEWMSKRYERKKKIQPEYHLIITEGTKTEPNYFKSIKELINQNYSERIHLEIVGQGDNTVNLFDKAKQLVNKASAETVYRISKVLGCTMEDLIEK